MSGEKVSGDGADAVPEVTAPLLDGDLPPTPSIPSGQAENEPPRPEAPRALPPAAPPPSGQPASPLEAEPASLEPPVAIAVEPMAPAPRDERGVDKEPPPLPVEEVQPRADVSPLPEAVRAPEPPPEQSAPMALAARTPPEPDAVRDQPAADETAIEPVKGASGRARPADRSQVLEDVVSRVEISPAQVGGVIETPLPGNRAGSPPAPLAAPRIGWNRPHKRWAYALMVVLAVLFLWLLVDLFRVG